MLSPVKKGRLNAKGAQFAIVASTYNSEYVDAMLEAAATELKRARAANVEVIRVPGAYEIPVVANELAKRRSVEAIICLGVILRGETSHAAHIGEAVSQALMQIQLTHGIPVIHEVLLLESHEQAKARCLGRKHNRGTEAAQTALEMVAVMRQLSRVDDCPF